MSQIRLDPDEFADIIMAFLLDALRDDDMLKNNERFREFIHMADSKGMKSELTRKFFDMNAEQRLKYKLIKDVFRGGQSSKLNIEQDTSLKHTTVDKVVDVAKKLVGLKRKRANEDFDRELCKRIFRKVKEVIFKTSKPITEERLDKIIDYCINEQEEQNNG